jgi:uncharacterized protein
MGIVQFIGVLLLVWLGFNLWRKLTNPPSRSGLPPSTHKMLSCCVCQTHIPENEAILKNGQVFCSKKCLG